MDPTPEDKLLSSTQAAEILGVSRQTVVRHITPSKVTPGGKRLYTIRAIRQQLDNADGGAAA